jgi:hypothetical protein
MQGIVAQVRNLLEWGLRWLVRSSHRVGRRTVVPPVPFASAVGAETDPAVALAATVAPGPSLTPASHTRLT